MGYIGSIQYAYNFNKVLKFIEKLFNNYQNINFLIFSNDKKQIIVKHLDNYNIPNNRIEIKSFSHKMISEEINSIDNDIKNLLSDKNIGFLYNFETNINIHKIYEEINKIYIKNKQYKYARKISEKIFSLTNAKNQYHIIYENLIE